MYANTHFIFHKKKIAYDIEWTEKTTNECLTLKQSPCIFLYVTKATLAPLVSSVVRIKSTAAGPHYCSTPPVGWPFVCGCLDTPPPAPVCVPLDFEQIFHSNRGGFISISPIFRFERLSKRGPITILPFLFHHGILTHPKRPNYFAFL